MVQFYTCLSWRKGKTESHSFLAACMATRATHSQVRMKQTLHVSLSMIFKLLCNLFGLIQRSFSCCFLWTLNHFCLSGDVPEYLITGTHAYPSGPGKYYAINPVQLHYCKCSGHIQWTASALFECLYKCFLFDRSSIDCWHKDAQESKWGRSPLHGAGFATLTSQVKKNFIRSTVCKLSKLLVQRYSHCCTLGRRRAALLLASLTSIDTQEEQRDLTLRRLLW